jgi:thioredoxin-related protein
MKLLSLALVAIFTLSSFTFPEPPAAEATIEWLTWEEAMQRMESEPKKIFVDVYTDWCGWCKKMDASTFVDPEVTKVMNEHFYAVKFDAEQEEDVLHDNHTFKYRSDVGRRGLHELAYALLDGKMSYPSFVYLDNSFQRISISPGYKDAAMMHTELRYIGENHFQDMTYEAFKAENSGN